MKKLCCRLGLMLNNVRFCFYEKSGQRYLAVIKTGWRGVKWSRHFEVVQEVTSTQEPLGFKANPTISI